MCVEGVYECRGDDRANDYAEEEEAHMKIPTTAVRVCTTILYCTAKYRSQ